MNDETILENFNFAVSQINAGLNNYNFSNDEKLTLYSFYKQATHGKCDKPEPPIYNIKEKAKWKQWNLLGNMTKNDAMLKYIQIYLNIANKR